MLKKQTSFSLLGTPRSTTWLLVASSVAVVTNCRTGSHPTRAPASLVVAGKWYTQNTSAPVTAHMHDPPPACDRLSAVQTFRRYGVEFVVSASIVHFRNNVAVLAEVVGRSADGKEHELNGTLHYYADVDDNEVKGMGYAALSIPLGGTIVRNKPNSLSHSYVQFPSGKTASIKPGKTIRVSLVMPFLRRLPTGPIRAVGISTVVLVVPRVGCPVIRIFPNHFTFTKHARRPGF